MVVLVGENPPTLIGKAGAVRDLQLITQRIIITGTGIQAR